MTNTETNLASYSTGDYSPGGGWIKRAFWYVTNVLFFLNPLFPFYGFKRLLLRLYGAKIGRAVVIKPNVNIKYPWNLEIGDHTWIGERAWIDNLGKTTIGSHVCISQGAMLLCGNHNYKTSGFDLMVSDIILENGSWVGARSIVGPGTRMGSHSILIAGSVSVGLLEPWGIYRGNPAIFIRERKFDNKQENEHS